MLAWMIYIAPIAPPALLKTHSVESVLSLICVAGYVAVRFVTICWALFGDTAMASFASS